MMMPVQFRVRNSRYGVSMAVAIECQGTFPGGLGGGGMANRAKFTGGKLWMSPVDPGSAGFSVCNASVSARPPVRAPIDAATDYPETNPRHCRRADRLDGDHIG